MVLRFGRPRDQAINTLFFEFCVTTVLQFCI